MTKKEFLLASFSALAALTLTGCGDTTEDKAKDQNQNQNQDQNQDDASTDLTDRIDDVVNALEDDGMAALINKKGQYPAGEKKDAFFAAAEELKQLVDATGSVAMSLRSAYEEGSYDALTASFDAYTKAMANKEALSAAAAKVTSAAQAYKSSAEYNAALTQGLDVEEDLKVPTDKAREVNATVSEDASFTSKIQKQIEKLNKNLSAMGGDVGVTSFSTQLVRDIHRKVQDKTTGVKSTAFGDSGTVYMGMPSRLRESLRSEGVSAQKPNGATDTNTIAVRKYFQDVSKLAMVKAGNLDGLSKDLYTSVLKDRLVVRAPGQDSDYSFTLKEWNFIASGNITTDKPAELNGKKAPKFKDGASVPAGGKPAQADVDLMVSQIEPGFVNIVATLLRTDDVSKEFFFSAERPRHPKPATTKLSAGLVKGLTQTSLRDARRGAFGLDAATFALNGTSGEKVALAAPIYVKLDGSLEAGKSVNATGTVATKVGNTVVAMTQAHANTGLGFKSDSVQSETSVAVSQNFGAAFAEVSLGTVEASNVNGADFAGSTAKLTLGYDAKYVTPFVQLERRNITRSELLDADVAHTSVALGAEVALANHVADTYSVSTNLKAAAGYETKAWTSLDRHLGTDAEFAGSLDFSGSLKLNSGVSFTSNLGLGSVKGASAGLNFSVAR